MCVDLIAQHVEWRREIHYRAQTAAQLNCAGVVQSGPGPGPGQAWAYDGRRAADDNTRILFGSWCTFLLFLHNHSKIPKQNICKHIFPNFPSPHPCHPKAGVDAFAASNLEPLVHRRLDAPPMPEKSRPPELALSRSPSWSHHLTAPMHLATVRW